jgi:predicted nucleic acid-binding protein
MQWFKNRQPDAASFNVFIRSALAGDVLLLMSSINLGEIYYSCSRQWGKAPAEEALRVLEELPIQVAHPTQLDVLLAARIKADHSISYADCFAVMLAIEYQCPVLTGDRDFLKVEHAGLVAVKWMGA